MSMTTGWRHWNLCRKRTKGEGFHVEKSWSCSRDNETGASIGNAEFLGASENVGA